MHFFLNSKNTEAADTGERAEPSWEAKLMISRSEYSTADCKNIQCLYQTLGRARAGMFNFLFGEQRLCSSGGLKRIRSLVYTFSWYNSRDP